MTDADLLAHYVARGAEPWNTSLEAAWLDYELRAWLRPRLVALRPRLVANIGIGVGLFDDWLGHELAASITSIDRDPMICALLELRQRAERHPNPARVVCGDARHVLGASRLDAITIVGSTLAEAIDREGVEAAARAALAPGGRLFVAETGTGDAPRDAHRLGAIWLSFRELTAGAPSDPR